MELCQDFLLTCSRRNSSISGGSDRRSSGYTSGEESLEWGGAEEGGAGQTWQPGMAGVPDWLRHHRLHKYQVLL